MDRILVDECLSVALVASAKARGPDATHVLWLGREGVEDWNLMPFIVSGDWNLMPFIVSGDFIFVTNNRKDFLPLYAETETHNGLIIILPSVRRDRQKHLFGLALDAAERLEDTINKLIEVDIDGNVTVANWPKAIG